MGKMIDSVKKFILFFSGLKFGKTQKFLFNISFVPIVFIILLPGYSYLAVYFFLKQILVLSEDPLHLLSGSFFFLIGVLIIGWTVWVFNNLGKGTPSPFIPTQKLVVRGPYRFCRNPMYLGALILLAGLGIMFNSLPFILFGWIEPLAYLVYVKLVEEKELKDRFGKSYEEYRKKVPFIIPRLPKRQEEK